MAKILGVMFLLLVTIITAHAFFAEGIINMDKYEWLPTESSYEMFPMRIIKGHLIFNDGSSLYIPSRRIMVNGWGELGSIHVVGNKLKPLPAKIDITYFSFAEDKFYSGVFSLPYEKISKLFRDGLQSHVTNKKITYQNIIVGIAPAGEISIWLMADGEVLLVANFRAKETKLDWKLVTENVEFSRATYIQRVLNESLKKSQVSELAQHGVPYAKLEAHGKQYSWNPTVTGSNPSHMWLKTYNGECEFIDLVKDSKQRRKLRATPKHFDIDWQDKTGKKYIGEVTFDEDEVLKAYQRLSNGKNDHEFQLHIRINEDSNTINLSLKDSQYIYKFEKAVTKIYER